MSLLAKTCHELGYLLILHDQYRDFYLNAASYNDRLAVQEWDGCRFQHAEWPGGRQGLLSARFAPGGQGVVWGQTGIGPHAKGERHFIPSILPYYQTLTELGRLLV